MSVKRTSVDIDAIDLDESDDNGVRESAAQAAAPGHDSLPEMPYMGKNSAVPQHKTTVGMADFSTVNTQKQYQLPTTISGVSEVQQNFNDPLPSMPYMGKNSAVPGHKTTVGMADFSQKSPQNHQNQSQTQSPNSNTIQLPNSDSHHAPVGQVSQLPNILGKIPSLVGHHTHNNRHSSPHTNRNTTSIPSHLLHNQQEQKTYHTYDLTSINNQHHLHVGDEDFNNSNLKLHAHSHAAKGINVGGRLTTVTRGTIMGSSNQQGQGQGQLQGGPGQSPSGSRGQSQQSTKGDRGTSPVSARSHNSNRVKTQHASTSVQSHTFDATRGKKSNQMKAKNYRASREEGNSQSLNEESRKSNSGKGPGPSDSKPGPSRLQELRHLTQWGKISDHVCIQGLLAFLFMFLALFIIPFAFLIRILQIKDNMIDSFELAGAFIGGVFILPFSPILLIFGGIWWFLLGGKKQYKEKYMKRKTAMMGQQNLQQEQGPDGTGGAGVIKVNPRNRTTIHSKTNKMSTKFNLNQNQNLQNMNKNQIEASLISPSGSRDLNSFVRSQSILSGGSPRTFNPQTLTAQPLVPGKSIINDNIQINQTQSKFKKSLETGPDHDSRLTVEQNINLNNNNNIQNPSTKQQLSSHTKPFKSFKNSYKGSLDQSDGPMNIISVEEVVNNDNDDDDEVDHNNNEDINSIGIDFAPSPEDNNQNLNQQNQSYYERFRSAIGVTGVNNSTLNPNYDLSQDDIQHSTTINLNKGSTLKSKFNKIGPNKPANTTIETIVDLTPREETDEVGINAITKPMLKSQPLPSKVMRSV